MAEKNLHDNISRLLVRVKPIFLKGIVDNLSIAQRQWVVENGLEKVLLFNIKEYPQPLSFLISSHTNQSSQKFQVGQKKNEAED